MNVPGFVGPAYMSISRAINAQRLVNLRLEVDMANGKAPLALVGLPGYRAVKTDFPPGEVRGFWRARSRDFVVVGLTLYELHADLTHTARGTLTTSGGPVSMADNGLQMLVVDGAGVLALTLATNATTTSIAHFPPGATHVVCVDNTFVANEGASQRFAFSAVGDGLSWAAIDFASAEGQPDDLVAIVAFRRQLYMLGAESIQVYWNSGDAERPFVPVEGSSQEVGCIAPGSAVEDESGVYWLGADSRGGARVYRAGGGAIKVISTPALSAEFAGSAGLPGQEPYTMTDARAWCYRMDDHSFYVLTFPTTDRTWLYDATTEGWSEWQEWGTDAEWHRHRGNGAHFTGGRQLIGDVDNGRLYELAGDIYSNDGRPLRALRASAHVAKDEHNIVVGSFEVVCEHGVGMSSGQGSDPLMALRVSKDGGATWTPEQVRPMGRMGAYRGRTRWARPCGAARDLVFEIAIADPVKRAIVGAVLNGV